MQPHVILYRIPTVISIQNGMLVKPMNLTGKIGLFNHMKKLYLNLVGVKDYMGLY